MVYLFTCICGKQYVGSTTTEFNLRFNQYKSNIVSSYSPLLLRGSQFSYKDLIVQIIDHCDPNDPEDREGLWIDKLDTMPPNGLNGKRALGNQIE